MSSDNYFDDLTKNKFNSFLNRQPQNHSGEDDIKSSKLLDKYKKVLEKNFINLAKSTENKDLKQQVPKQHTPKQHMPKQHMPKQHTPKQQNPEKKELLSSISKLRKNRIVRKDGKRNNRLMRNKSKLKEVDDLLDIDNIKKLNLKELEEKSNKLSKPKEKKLFDYLLKTHKSKTHSKSKTHKSKKHSKSKTHKSKTHSKSKTFNRKNFINSIILEFENTFRSPINSYNDTTYKKSNLGQNLLNLKKCASLLRLQGIDNDSNSSENVKLFIMVLNIAKNISQSKPSKVWVLNKSILNSAIRKMEQKYNNFNQNNQQLLTSNCGLEDIFKFINDTEISSQKNIRIKKYSYKKINN